MADLRKLLPLAALLVAPACAQQQPPDPANLTYEHVAPQALADTLPINHGAPALQQLLVKLRTRASMMMIVAHPDDEDGGFLTYESRGQGARVAMLTLTRGEGGQNLMSADFDDALGLIRTQELLAADRYEGVDQYFGTEVDFGFSKTKEESFQKWTHDRVLYDAVRCVRLYRPLVLASVFVGGPTDGHGHHQVAGEIAQEVFLAAADPKVFPEMGLPPWAPLKVYARVPFSRVSGDGMFDYATGKTVPVLFHNYVTGQDIHQAPVATVQIHEGEKSTLIGMAGDSYIQFARKGLALQKTQIGGGAGRLAPSGDFNVGYTLMATRLGCSNSGTLASAGGPEGTPSLQPVSLGGKPEGTPSLQAGVSQGPSKNEALAPGVCSPATASESSIFEGIDTSIQSMATLAPHLPMSFSAGLTDMDNSLARAAMMFEASKAPSDLIALQLADALKRTDGLIAGIQKANLPAEEKFNLLHELRIKRVQLNDAVALALGLQLEALVAPSANALSTFPDNTPTGATVSPGTTLSVAIRLMTGTTPIKVYPPTLQTNIAGIHVSPEPDEPHPPTTVPGQTILTSRSVDLPLSTDSSRPPFTRPNIEQPFYDVTSCLARNAPQCPAPFIVRQVAIFDGVAINVYATVGGVTELTSGRLARQTLNLVPPVSYSVQPTLAVIPRGTSAFSITTSLSDPNHLNAPLEVQAFPHWFEPETSKPWVQTTDKIHTFTLHLPPDFSLSTTVRLQVRLPNSLQYTLRPVGYPGVETSYLFTRPSTRVIPVDVTTAPNLHIAFLPGTGDAVPDFLPNLGVTPTLLTLKDLTPETLARYEAVILGVRAYAAHPELAGAGSKPLLDYAQSGGIVILEYMTARYGDAEAPYPIAVPGDSAHNVVVEAEPVQLLAPAHPLLTWPNKITSADFNNWVEERGHGFASSWSSEYTPLLETHDPDQDPQKGGLLLAKVGKGAYIYCALALYRQLPEGVPGAYRLMANLLSYAKNPNR